MHKLILVYEQAFIYLFYFPKIIFEYAYSNIF